MKHGSNEHDEPQKMGNKKSIPFRNGFEAILRTHMGRVIVLTHQTHYEMGYFFYFLFYVVHLGVTLCVYFHSCKLFATMIIYCEI